MASIGLSISERENRNVWESVRDPNGPWNVPVREESRNGMNSRGFSPSVAGFSDIISRTPVPQGILFS
jgi:hypothetical protein